MTLIEETTFSKQKSIEELKNRTIQDCTPKMLEDPHLFHRFLKARDFNLKQAEVMLGKHIAWRQEYGIDTILTDYKPPKVLKKYAPSNMLGFDKDGSPIRYISISGTDGPGFHKACKRVDLIKYHFQFTENDMDLLLQQSKKLGKPVTKTVYIYDYNKMTFAKATHKPSIDTLIIAIKMIQDNYPERIKSIYVINTSIYFYILYSVLKVFIAPAVTEKIRFFGADGWKEALLEIIDPDVLPAFLGGKRTDPDGNPLCKSFVNHGGIIPKSYYQSKSEKKLHLEQGVKKINLTPFSSTNLTFDVNESGSILEWEFETKSKDIGFGVYFKENCSLESKGIELVPKQRIDTDIEPEVGMFKCEKAGSYIIQFDNSYSWINFKEIYYRAKIIPPSEQDLK